MQIHKKISQIFKRITLHVSQNKMLLLAIMISLILHSLVFTKFSISFPELNIERQMLEMRLVKLPTPQKSIPASIKKKSTSPKIAPVIEKPRAMIMPLEPEPLFETMPAPLHEINSSAEIPANTEILPEATTQYDTQEAAPMVTETVPTELIEKSTELSYASDIQKPQPYKYIETFFKIRRGNDTTAAGEAQIIFNLKPDNTYRISSITEAKGLASLFLKQLKQVSEGAVTQTGLVPFYYLYQYGNDTKKIQHADFLWSDGVLEMFSSKGKKTEKLLPGMQDLLSFMYQFMFTPPLENNSITMTNGKNLRTYIYSFQGEESITTDFEEDLNTIHLLKEGDGDEKTELWLAIDYQNLPVKIRKTEKDGSVIEQIATKIFTVSP